MTKRSKITLFGLLALIAAFGLILTGCPDANGGGDTKYVVKPLTPKSASLTLTNAAHDGKNLKLAVDGGEFAASAQVYFKDDGTQIYVTSGTPPEGHTLVAASAYGTGRRILKSDSAVAVAAAAPVTPGDLLEGPITVTIATDAFTASVTAARAALATPVQIDANSSTAYVVVGTLAAVTGNNTIFYDASGVASTDSSANRAPLASGQTPLDPDFDAQYIAVLSNLVAGDKIICGASFVVDSAEFLSAATAAKINGAFGGTDTVILSAASALSGNVIVPPAGTLTVKGVAVTLNGGISLGAGAEIDASAASSSLLVGSAADGVSFGKATITAGANGDIITANTATASAIVFAAGGTATIAGTGELTVGGSTDTVTLKNAVYTSTVASTFNSTCAMAPTNFLELTAGGVIETAGAGKLTAGATTFDGDGAWTVTALAGDATSLKILSAGTGATLSNQGSPSGSSTVLAASGTPLITQGVVSSSNLALPALLTIDLGGDASAAAGGIKVIADGTNPGKITVAAAVTCEIKTGNTGGSVITVGTANGISTASGAGKLTASAANAFAVKTLSGSNKLESITGTGNGPGTLSGNAGSTAPVTINSEFEVTG